MQSQLLSDAASVVGTQKGDCRSRASNSRIVSVGITCIFLERNCLGNVRGLCRGQYEHQRRLPPWTSALATKPIFCLRPTYQRAEFVKRILRRVMRRWGALGLQKDLRRRTQTGCPLVSTWRNGRCGAQRCRHLTDQNHGATALRPTTRSLRHLDEKQRRLVLAVRFPRQKQFPVPGQNARTIRGNRRPGAPNVSQSCSGACAANPGATPWSP